MSGFDVVVGLYCSDLSFVFGVFVNRHEGEVVGEG